MFGDTFFNETLFTAHQKSCSREEDLYSPWGQDVHQNERFRIYGQINKKTSIKRRYASEMEVYSNLIASTQVKMKEDQGPTQKKVIKTSVTISYEQPKTSYNKIGGNPNPIKLPVLSPKRHKEDNQQESKKVIKLNESLLRENNRASLKKYVNNRSKSPSPNFQIFKRQLISTRRYISNNPEARSQRSNF